MHRGFQMSTKTVLIVEDDLQLQGLITEALNTTTDYKPVVAESGEDALAYLETEKPDLILLDMLLPVIGGSALFSDLRNNESTKDIPVIFMSGQFDDEKFRHEAIELGGIDFLHKPFGVTDLIEKIQNLLK